MDNEKESSDKFFSIISDLRKKWINSLFRKIFGFEPSYSISLKGDAEERFEILAKMTLWMYETLRKTFCFS